MAYPFPYASRGARPSIPRDKAVSRLSTARLGRLLRRGDRRLAVVDTHFPWVISGFRYRECLQIHALRPDTLFFSLYELTDPFPATVHPLASFPRLAAREGVTDVYLVFLNLAVAFLGLADADGAEAVRGKPPLSLRRVVDSLGLNVHVQLYPGGGLAPDVPPQIVEAVGRHCSTVFTNVSEVEAVVPDAVATPMLVGADAYPFRDRRSGEDLRLVFVGDDKSRKGLSTLIAAFNELPPGVHLDIVGPNERHLSSIENAAHRAHGWLAAPELRRLYEECDVFVSPATVETEDELERGIVDGFPTTAAAEAMASGCALVSSNPRREFRALQPGSDYVDVPEGDAGALAAALVALADDRRALAELSVRGAMRVRSFSTEIVVREKLGVMGLLEPARVHERTRARVQSLLEKLPQDTGGGSSLAKALVVGDLIVEHDVYTLVEIGVYRGRFLLPAALILHDLGRGPAIGIDPYSATEAKQDLERVHPDHQLVDEWTSSLDWDAVYADVLRMIDDNELAATCMLVRRPSRLAVHDLDDGAIGLLHIDGNHDRRHVEEDLRLYLPKLRSGGILVMDDVSWPSVSGALADRREELEIIHEQKVPGVDDFAVYRVVST